MSKTDKTDLEQTPVEVSKPKAKKVDPMREKVLDMAVQFNVNQIASMLAIPAQQVKQIIDDYNKEA